MKLKVHSNYENDEVTDRSVTLGSREYNLIDRPILFALISGVASTIILGFIAVVLVTFLFLSAYVVIHLLPTMAKQVILTVIGLYCVYAIARYYRSGRTPGWLSISYNVTVERPETNDTTDTNNSNS